MPQRIGRIVIKNTSGDLELRKTADHLCGGKWTSNQWKPPEVISPGKTGSMQSESSGDLPLVGNIFTGTEGYVKYDVLNGPTRLGMIYIYWDNPWHGVTGPRWVTDARDVKPDCDYEDPEDESVFRIDKDLDFSLALTSYRHTHGGGEITSAGDLIAAATEGAATLGIPYLLGLTGIQKDPEWTFELTHMPVKLVDQGPLVTRAMTDAVLDDWIGVWKLEDVEVQIRKLSIVELTASISPGQGEPVTTVTFQPTMEFVAAQGIRPGIADKVLAGAQLQSITHESALRIAGMNPQSKGRAALADQFESIAQKIASEQEFNGPIVVADSPRIGAIVGKALADSNSSISAGGFHLALYAEYEGDQRARRMLLLQRYAAGAREVDVMLPRYENIN